MKKLLCLMLLFISNICLAASYVANFRITKCVSVTPVLSLVPYSAGDQVGAKYKIPALLDNDSKAAVLMSATTIDLDAQGAAMQVWYFSQEPMTVAGDNNPFAVSDADMVYALGALTAGSGFATGTGNINAISSGVLGGLGFYSTAKDPGGKSTGDVWAVMRTVAGTPTYTSTSSLIMKFCVQ